MDDEDHYLLSAHLGPGILRVIDVRTNALVRALLYPSLGRKKEADALLVSLERQPDFLMPLDIAEVYAFHNDRDRAFEWLDRQYRVDPKYLRSEVHSDPLLANLRGDARFKSFCEN